MKTIIQTLSAAIIARDNCKISGNAQWLDRHNETIRKIMADTAPSGSGFDNGTNLDDAQKDCGRVLSFTTAYHHMSESGMYDGWTDHVVRARATFSGIDITVSGSDRNGIKDYIRETFDIWLTSQAPE